MSSLAINTKRLLDEMNLALSLQQENLQDWLNHQNKPFHQALCLNALRQAEIEFLNLGNIIYCPQQKLLLIFKQKFLQRCDHLKDENIFA